MKILTWGIFVLSLLLTSPIIVAAEPSPATATPTATSTPQQPITETKVIVTEKIPGMECTFLPTKSSPKEEDSLPANRKYECTIKPGFWSVMDILGGLIKYATFIVALIWVLMLVVSGIQYSLAGFDKESAGKAKGRIVKVLWGIILLFLTGLILNSVAPWIYK